MPILRTANINDVNLLKRKIAQDEENFHWAKDIDFLGSNQILYVWGDDAIGFVLLQAIDTEAEIIMVWLNIANRRQGQGSLMIKSLMEKLKSNGIENIFLEVAKDNFAAIKAYEAAGFKRLGIRKNYYHRGDNDYMDAINMGATI